MKDGHNNRFIMINYIKLLNMNEKLLLLLDTYFFKYNFIIRLIISIINYFNN